MGLLREKVMFMSPLKEQEQGDGNGVDDYYDHNVSTDGCDCFPLFCFKWWRSNEDDRLLHHNEAGEYREAWWIKKLKKVKEASEVCAGPKWKTFIRKVGGYIKRDKYKKTFQYDPQSYALNFDNGVDMKEDCFVPFCK